MMPLEQPYQASSDGTQQDTLLLSKLRPPRSVAALIERPALLELLERMVTGKLTLLSAPAGFGKTTLLQQWLDRQRQTTDPPMSVAWVSLDERDNDPLRFWSYLSAAGQAFQPRPTQLDPHQVVRNGAQFGPPALLQWITTFVNEITQLDCQGLLMLEDYHVISEPQVHQTLLFLIEQLPPGLHIVLITRTDPPFSLARLRATHQLLEIHADRLAFSKTDTLRFLQQTLSFDLPQTVADRIEEQMEGWIAGLRLFSLGFQGRTRPDDIQHLLASFTGRHRYVLDYFLTEVLSTQSASVQIFLLQTSHLQRLCASLCDTVTAGADSGQTLAEIERAGLFLQAIADSEGWYRYHALFAEAMQNEARQRLGEAQIALCLERAQHWYEQHHFLDEAIETALQRHAYADMLALLERLLKRQDAVSTQVYALVRWLQPMPEALLATSPALCFAYASALTFSSSSDQLEVATFTRVMTLLQYAEEQLLKRQQVLPLAEVHALRAMIFVRQGKVPQAAAAARQALALFSPDQQSVWRVISQTILALETRWLGHFQVAYQAMFPGLSVFGDAQEQQGSIILNLLLGELCLEQGSLYKAEELFQTVLRDTAEGSNDQARALLGMAQLAYERNLLVQAEQQTQRVLALSTTINDRSLQVQATLILARIAAARSKPQEAIKLLQARLVHLDPAQFRQQYYELSLTLAGFELSSGNSTAAQRWLSSQTAETRLSVARYQQEQEVLLRARWLLQQDAAPDVLNLLKPWQEEAASNERLRSTLEIGLLMTFAYHQIKRSHEARQQLRELLLSAHSEHFQRLFLDHGTIVTSLLSAQLTTTREKSLQVYIRTLLQAFDTRQERSAGATVADTAALLNALSPQERQVLRLLVSGMERQEIAEHLVISLNTVKTHLQRLYQKLHVTSRFEAVELARNLDFTD